MESTSKAVPFHENNTTSRRLARVKMGARWTKTQNILQVQCMMHIYVFLCVHDYITVCGVLMIMKQSFQRPQTFVKNILSSSLLTSTRIPQLWHLSHFMHNTKYLPEQRVEMTEARQQYSCRGQFNYRVERTSNGLFLYQKKKILLTKFITSSKWNYLFICSCSSYLEALAPASGLAFRRS